jgi:hypothetical protein
MNTRVYGQFALWLVLSCSGCMDLGQSGVPKPTRPEPRAAADEEPVPPPADPPPVADAPAPAPPAAPDPKESEKYVAAYEHLGRVAKDLDDFAYDRKGRMTEAQMREYLALCNKEVAAVEAEVPALQPACEALGTMVFYASPLNASIAVDKRLTGYQQSLAVFKQNMTQLAPKAAR